MSRGCSKVVRQVASSTVSAPFGFSVAERVCPCSSANALVQSPRAHSFPTVFGFDLKAPGAQNGSY